MDFRSDNVTGAHPKIVDAVVEANQGSASAYGGDPWTARVKEHLGAVFEREVTVLPVATGTGANALSLSLMTPPWGAVFCHVEAHVQVAECGAPEFFTGGAKLVGVPGEEGKFTPRALEKAIAAVGSVHAVTPAVVSLSQATEAGTVYRPGEIRALAETARARGMSVHMDGARFANALVAARVAPADLTWRAGVDVLSFGATKNGCFAAEAVVLFDSRKAEEALLRRKRAGLLQSKMRFVSAQLEAYLTDGLWLANAGHANDMATELAALLGSAGFNPVLPVETNEVFARIPARIALRARERGYLFHDWPAFGADVRRLITAFDTRREDVVGLVATIVEAAGEG